MSAEQDYQSCVNILKNRIFLGHYAGRHRVDEIDEFRDVINLDSSEEELQRDIDTLLTSFSRSRPSVWIAFSDSTINGAYSLWVQLDRIAFGHYWFQIKHVRMTRTELFCVVNVLRSVPAQLVNPTFSFSQGFESAMRALKNVSLSKEEPASTAQREKSNVTRNVNSTPRGSKETNSARDGNRSTNSETTEERRETQNQDNVPIQNVRPFHFLKDFKNVTFGQIKDSFANEEIGVNLIKTILVCFFFTLIGMMSLMYESLVVFTNIVVVTGDVTIKGIHAFSRLIESVSPIFLGALNFVGKLVTGLYILIAMLFGCTPYVPSQQNKASPPRRPAIMYR